MKRTFCTAAALAFAALPATAATINIDDFSAGAYAAATSAMSGGAVENFESYSEGNVANGFSTAVGTFSTTGGTGSGGTVTGSIASGNFAGNDGSMLALRDGNVYGRRSTTSALSGNAADDMFLDSNDTYGIRWDVFLGGTSFNKLVFTLMDATDVGATMLISGGGVTQTISGLGNGATKLVTVLFDTEITTASILFDNTNGNGQKRLNDGFSIDDVSVGTVPLPAGGLLLIAGLGGLAALRRRKMQA